MVATQEEANDHVKRLLTELKDRVFHGNGAITEKRIDNLAKEVVKIAEDGFNVCIEGHQEPQHLIAAWTDTNNAYKRRQRGKELVLRTYMTQLLQATNRRGLLKIIRDGFQNAGGYHSQAIADIQRLLNLDEDFDEVSTELIELSKDVRIGGITGMWTNHWGQNDKKRAEYIRNEKPKWVVQVYLIVAEELERFHRFPPAENGINIRPVEVTETDKCLPTYELLQELVQLVRGGQESFEHQWFVLEDAGSRMVRAANDYGYGFELDGMTFMKAWRPTPSDKDLASSKVEDETSQSAATVEKIQLRAEIFEWVRQKLAPYNEGALENYHVPKTIPEDMKDVVQNLFDVGVPLKKILGDLVRATTEGPIVCSPHKVGKINYGKNSNLNDMRKWTAKEALLPLLFDEFHRAHKIRARLTSRDNEDEWNDNEEGSSGAHNAHSVALSHGYENGNEDEWSDSEEGSNGAHNAHSVALSHGDEKAIATDLVRTELGNRRDVFVERERTKQEEAKLKTQQEQHAFELKKLELENKKVELEKEAEYKEKELAAFSSYINSDVGEVVQAAFSKVTASVTPKPSNTHIAVGRPVTTGRRAGATHRGLYGAPRTTDGARRTESPFNESITGFPTPSTSSRSGKKPTSSSEGVKVNLEDRFHPPTDVNSMGTFGGLQSIDPEVTSDGEEFFEAAEVLNDDAEWSLEPTDDASAVIPLQGLNGGRAPTSLQKQRASKIVADPVQKEGFNKESFTTQERSFNEDDFEGRFAQEYDGPRAIIAKEEDFNQEGFTTQERSFNEDDFEGRFAQEYDGPRAIIAKEEDFNQEGFTTQERSFNEEDEEGRFTEQGDCLVFITKKRAPKTDVSPGNTNPRTESPDPWSQKKKSAPSKKDRREVLSTPRDKGEEGSVITSQGTRSSARLLKKTKKNYC